MQLHACDGLGMATIEAFGQSEDRGEGSDRLALLARQVAESFVAALGCRLPVIAREQRHDFDLVGFETAQITIADQVVRMPVMLLVADMDTDVVQKRSVLQPFTIAIGEAMDAARLIE